MNYIQQTINFANELVLDNKSTTNRLNFKEKSEFARLLFETEHRDASVISDSINYDDMAQKLVNVLNNNTDQNKIDLANCLINNLIEYYEIQMCNILEKSEDLIEHEKITNYGQKPIRYYKDNGEIMTCI